MKKILFLIMLAITSKAFAQTASLPSAEQVIADAVKQAKKERKKVFIMFHASWCGWCKKMDATINEPTIKPLFDKSFVLKHLTVYEKGDKENLNNPGAEDLIKKYNSDGFGIPLWFIFDEKGELLVDSHIRPEGTGFETKGENIIGCPGSKEECDEFIKILKKTTKLTPQELEKIYTQFRKNDPTTPKQG